MPFLIPVRKRLEPMYMLHDENRLRICPCEETNFSSSSRVELSDVVNGYDSFDSQDQSLFLRVCVWARCEDSNLYQALDAGVVSNLLDRQMSLAQRRH